MFPPPVLSVYVCTTCDTEQERIDSLLDRVWTKRCDECDEPTLERTATRSFPYD